jgi:hypothetical protein
MAVLDQEMATYRRHKEKLLDHEGQFVLIHGDDIAGVWPTQDEAVQQGYDRFELDVFMVKKIERVERPLFFSRNVKPCQISDVKQSRHSLEREMATYRRNKEQLLEQEGQHVLIQGNIIAGVWPSCEEALQQGYDRFGLEQFMVKKIERVEIPLYFSRNIIPCPSSTAKSPNQDPSQKS